MTANGSQDLPRFKVCSVVLEGLAERAEKMESELRKALSVFEVSDLETIHDVNLTVIVSNQMASHVDRIRNEHGSAQRAPYNRIRSAVAACGIAFCAPIRPPLAATIVLDAGAWMTDDGDNVVQRAYLIGHEVGHVLQFARSPAADLDGNVEIQRTHAAETRRAAAAILDEFDADITAEMFCRMVLRDDQDRSVKPGTILGPSYVDAARDLIDRLARFAIDDVQSYRITSVRLEDLYAKACPLIGELLTVLTHAVAFYAGGDCMSQLDDGLRRARGFTEYVGDDWESFKAALSGENSAPVNEIARIFDAVFLRVGLQIEDLPNGEIYVHVSEPVFVEP